MLPMKCLIILFLLTIFASCEKETLSDDKMFLGKDLHEVLFASGRSYNLEAASINFDIRDIINRKLPRTQHIDYFGYYRTGILFVVTEDMDSEKVQENRILYYMDENKQLQEIVRFKAVYPGPFYLQNDYLFCFSYPELIAIDIDAGVIHWRKELDVSSGAPNQLYVDVDRGIYIMGYEKDKNEIKMINLADNSGIKIFKGIITCFDHANKDIFYRDSSHQLFVYNYDDRKTKKIEIIDKKSRPDNNYKLCSIYFVARDKLILDYSLHHSVLIPKLIFPWADPYIDYHFYYNGRLNEGLIEKYGLFSIPEKENTSQIISIRLFDNTKGTSESP
jgi:hypothetical protein